jgi:hypothetical protein
VGGPAEWEPPKALAKVVPPPLLAWAKQDSPSEHSALAAIALAAVASPAKTICEARLCEVGILPELRGSQGDDGDGEGGGQAPANKKKPPPPVQRTLTDELVESQPELHCLDKDLRRSGAAGKLVRAQLRSQRRPGALAWLSAQPDRISPAGAVIMLLVAVMVDPYNVGGETCPFGSDCVDGPTCVHAIGCHWWHRQHLRGHNVVHKQQKRTLQRIKLQSHAGWISTEDASIFRVANGRMDTRGKGHAPVNIQKAHGHGRGTTFCIFTGACP